MTLHLPTLLFVSVAIMATAAALMTAFGRTRRIYPGYWWWTTAQWLATVGLALQLLRAAAPAVLPLSNLLLLQAPILILLGVRRFYPRHEVRIPVLADALLLAFAYLAWLAAWSVGAGTAVRVTVFGVGSCVLHLYSAALIARLRDFEQSTALRALVTAQLVAALVQLARALQPHIDAAPWLAGGDLMLASGLISVLLALVMVYLAMLLTYERTERKLHQSQRQLRFLADTDTLTEVPNRRRFYELATRALALGAPGRSAVVMFDLDHFKRINDLHGHAEGDEALREVARCTREILRGRDVAGRIGGDEFALLLPETSVDEALAVASRIATQLNVARPTLLPPLTLSVGVVISHEGENIADSLRRADQALYEAKRQGRSRAVAASAGAAGPVFTESQRMGLGAR
jgi:diguanylate cyclase